MDLLDDIFIFLTHHFSDVDQKPLEQQNRTENQNNSTKTWLSTKKAKNILLYYYK